MWKGNTSKFNKSSYANNLHFYWPTTGSLVHTGEQKEWVQHNKLKQVTK